MNAEIKAIKLRQEEILARLRMLERTVGIAQNLQEKDEESEAPDSPLAPNSAPSDRPLSNRHLSQAARSDRTVDSAIWTQYELILSLSSRLTEISKAIIHARSDNQQRFDTLERNVGEVKEGVQSIAGLLTKDS